MKDMIINSTFVISTITQSTSDEDYSEIPKDYFVTKNQKVNKKYQQEGGEAYKDLKMDLLSAINSFLKSMMIIQSQKIGLEVADVKTKNQGFVRVTHTLG